MTQEVRGTPELERILKIPRRTIDPVAAAQLAKDMTEVLKTPNGQQELRIAQALALHDAALHGGGFCPLGVGEGKSLVTLLAPWVLDAKRSMLFLPAGLIKKTTDIDIPEYSKHWLIPKNIRLFSYEMLGRVQAAMELEKYAPDLLILDEAHKAKSRRAAVTRRLMRYLHDHPDTKVIVLSGTMMRKSLLDFAHLARWSLKNNAPVPKTEHELDEWALALDEKVTDEARFAPGALLRLCTSEEVANNSPTVAARLGFQRRLLETPGVVATQGEGERVDCSIYIRAITYDLKPVTDAHFKKLRDLWRTPDDWVLYRAADVWRHARELANGLHYRWNPRPPDEWIEARRNWHSFVREVLSRSRTLDSPKAVALACDEGKYPTTELNAWRAIKPTFTPNSEPVWHDDSTLKLCLDWMKEPGIVWTDHRFFGQRLSELSGAKYYGPDGLAPDGELIDFATSGTVIASVKANKEGRNLQKKWNRNLILSPFDGSDLWEQVIGRTHRTGQTADEVIVDVLLGCMEHANAWRKAVSAAQSVKDTVGVAQKILTADVSWPTEEEIARFAGPRWQRTEDHNSAPAAG